MRVKITSPITHGDHLYLEGSVVDLDDATAALLIDRGMATKSRAQNTSEPAPPDTLATPEPAPKPIKTARLDAPEDKKE